MKIFNYLVFILLLNLVVGCQSGTRTGQGTDLMKYGIPFTVMAPEDVNINKVGGGTMQDLNIKNDKDYDIQIFMSDAYTSNLTRLKQEKKDEIETYRGFKRIVEEYDDGFIYQKENPDGSQSYDFYIVKIQGSKVINFTCGNSGSFTEKQVKEMIKSISY